MGEKFEYKYSAPSIEERKEIDSIRTNVVIKKVKSTPLQYPRGKNLPKQNPIK